MLEVIRGVLTDAERFDQMQQAINLHAPFLTKSEKLKSKPVSIACYGPSLLDTWATLKMHKKVLGRQIISVSGAHDFLVSRGITPDYHVEIDPREHKPKMLRSPQKTTKYLMASVCHPDFWDILAGHDLTLWHLINDQSTVDWVREHHPAGLKSMIGGGSTVGQRAMNVAAAMGYREFHIFGMDFSFDGARHASTHTGEPEPETHVSVYGKGFRTTPQLMQAAREMEEFLKNTTDVKATFHGTGLMQEVAKRIKEKA